MDEIFELDKKLIDYGLPFGDNIADEVITENIQTEFIKKSFIDVQSYEIKEPDIYANIKYKIYDSYTNKLIDEIYSTDGFVKFMNLNINRQYNISVEDTALKYNGKYISNITPELDLEKSIKIIKISETMIDNKYTCQLKIIYNGEPQVNITGPNELKLNKITEDYYEVSGILYIINFSFEVYLDDYVDEIVYRVNKIIKYGE